MQIFCEKLQKLRNFCRLSPNLAEIIQNRWFLVEIFSEFCRNCGKWQIISKILNIFQKFAKSKENSNSNNIFNLFFFPIAGLDNFFLVREFFQKCVTDFLEACPKVTYCTNVCPTTKSNFKSWLFCLFNFTSSRTVFSQVGLWVT